MELARGDRVSETIRHEFILGDKPRYAEGVITRVHHPMPGIVIAKVLWDEEDLRTWDPEGTWRPVSKLNYLGRSQTQLDIQDKPARPAGLRSFTAK